MKQENSFLKEEFKKKIDKLNDTLTKKNVLFILLVYVIGTVIVMLRNFNEGIPFSTYSIVSYGILTFYLVVLSGVSWIVKWIVKEIMNNQYDGGKIKNCFKKIGSCLLIMTIILIIMIALMSIFLYDTEPSLIKAYAILLYILIPVLGNSKLHKNIGEFAVILMITSSFSVILSIPASIGGLKPINVSFHDYQTKITHEYLYFGESNGNYVFKQDENKIILRSIDSGYIEYYKEEIEEQEKQMKYKVEIKETLSKIIEIEAKNEEEAIRKIREQYEKQEIVLDSSDYVDTEFNVYREYQ